MPFELTEKTPATLTSVTPRTERHGDESVPALSLGVRIEAPNTLLANLSPRLLQALYTSPETPEPQAQIEGTELTNLPLLRCNVIDALTLRGELNGWRLAIDYGIDDSTAIHASGCKVDKFTVEPKEGGSVVLRFRIGTADVAEEDVGKLWGLLGGHVMLTLCAPEPKQEPIDGSAEAFERDHPGAEAQGDLLDTGAPAMDATDVFMATHGAEA